jgi:hypothetical protein
MTKARPKKKGRKPGIVLRTTGEYASQTKEEPAAPKEYHPYTLKLATELCRRMGDDGQSIRQICRAPDMPSMGAVYRWLTENPEFEDIYTKARQKLYEHWAEDIHEIADTPVEGTKIVVSPDGTTTTYMDAIEHRKLRIEARKWLLGKLVPKKYGDKLDLNLGGQPDGAPLKSLSILAITTDPVEAAKLYQAVMRGDVVPALPTSAPK